MSLSVRSIAVLVLSLSASASAHDLAWANPDRPTTESKASADSSERVSPSRVVETTHAVDVYSQPAARSRYQRGLVAKRARFAVLETAAGKDCKGEWLRIAEHGWICSRATRSTDESPSAEPSAEPKLGDDLLPRQYVVTRDAVVYDTLEQAARAASEAGTPVSGQDQTSRKNIRGLGGFVKGRTARRNGKRFVQTPHGWVPASEIQSVVPSTFKGVSLSAQDRGKRLAFVRVPRARLYDAQGVALDERGPERQTYLGEVAAPIEGAGESKGQSAGQRLYALDARGDRHVRAEDISLIPWSERPADVAENERWVDVILSQQLLVAYQGDDPVMATLVSTARTATTPGEYRIQKKRAFGRLRAKPEFNTQWDVHVPWVMTLDGRLAMHTVYWHENFGKPFSQGCVNLAPVDAKWLWDWTEPALPAGWLRVTSDDQERGSLVRIRK